jgi:hypothetical protein
VRSKLPVFLLLAAAASSTSSQPGGTTPPCRIEPFRGASSPQGADARASMVNRGQSCVFRNYGIPEERGNPAESGSITRLPANGKAVFSAPAAVYTPDPGFSGTDSFEYQPTAFNRAGSPVRLTVRVSVAVSAP